MEKNIDPTDRGVPLAVNLAVLITKVALLSFLLFSMQSQCPSEDRTIRLRRFLCHSRRFFISVHLITFSSFSPSFLFLFFFCFLLRYATIRFVVPECLCPVLNKARAYRYSKGREEPLARLLSVIIRQVVINWKPGSDKAEPGTRRLPSNAAWMPRKSAAFSRAKVSPLGSRGEEGGEGPPRISESRIFLPLFA